MSTTARWSSGRRIVPPALVWLAEWPVRLTTEYGWSLALAFVAHPRGEATADEVVATGGKLQLSIWNAVVSPAGAPIVSSETEITVQTSFVFAVFSSLIYYVLFCNDCCLSDDVIISPKRNGTTKLGILSVPMGRFERPFCFHRQWSLAVCSITINNRLWVTLWIVVIYKTISIAGYNLFCKSGYVWKLLFIGDHMEVIKINIIVILLGLETCRYRDDF